MFKPLKIPAVQVQVQMNFWAKYGLNCSHAITPTPAVDLLRKKTKILVLVNIRFFGTMVKTFWTKFAKYQIELLGFCSLIYH